MPFPPSFIPMELPTGSGLVRPSPEWHPQHQASLCRSLARAWCVKTAPILHHPPFGQTPREARCLSSSTRSEAVRVQRAEGSEGGPAGSPPPLSPALEPNCPLERMKVSVASLFLLILILATTSALRNQERIPEWVNPPPTCCLTYHKKVLPRKLVVGYKKAFNCHLPAIIFITKQNREICTNPDDAWVQKYIKDPKLSLQPSRVSA
ncbi:C-C motif chemokine 16 [Phacochoerus africanus]|uniref:C-C motif chemokine 16 n=1 Tax=Phacochoerus africanus TaxID=41426 RepID=UPI001FD9C6E0|nr:C-C motif chemokine 16 [Phacochoerus africanus]